MDDGMLQAGAQHVRLLLLRLFSLKRLVLGKPVHHPELPLLFPDGRNTDTQPVKKKTPNQKTPHQTPNL